MGAPGRALEVREVRKRFGAVDVLRGVTLSADPGTFLTLLGPSGCGKTTLLRIVAGLELADSGSVTLGGEDLLAKPAQQRPVNTVFQQYALFPHLTVADNVAFGLRARRFPEADVARKVGEALELLQLGELAARLPAKLSGGQKQRVALARALVNEPDILLLDEPMSALDAKLRAQVQLELRRLQRRIGRTFVLVTHDQDEALTVSDRILVMREGCIEQAGAPEDVYARPRTRFVAEFLGAANLIEATRDGGACETALGRLEPAEKPAWTRGCLCIRPEKLELSATRPEGTNTIEATLEEVVYRGDHVEVFLGASGLRARAPALNGLVRGARVWVRLPAAHLMALEA
ncbi:MAG: polyamine-transporting ATPase [Planctomycetota bacterium]